MTKEIFMIGGAGILLYMMMAPSQTNTEEAYETKRHKEHNRRHMKSAKTLEQFSPNIIMRRNRFFGRFRSNTGFMNFQNKFPKPTIGII